jgi:carboxymethylenebutenolidase
LAVPAGEGPYPALILIHEWWGLNDNIRSLADDFSYQGYVALAIDLYNGQSTTDPGQAGTLANSVRDNPDQAFINLQAAVNYLKSQSYVDPTKLASVGWCFGGGWSYQMAKNDLGTRASVMYYGQFNKEDDLSHMTSLIQGHFGAQDQSIPVDSVKAFQAKLKTLSGEHEVYIYENAGHAFANADNQAAYRQESAKEAWDRTLTFLNKVFPDQN